MARKSKARQLVVDNGAVKESDDHRRVYRERDYGLDCTDYLPAQTWPRGACSKSLTCDWVGDMLNLSGHGEICSGKRKETNENQD